MWVLSACLVLGGAGRYGLAACLVGSLVVWAVVRRNRVGACYAALAAVSVLVGAGAALRQADDTRCVSAAAARLSSAPIELRGWVSDFPRSGPYGASFAFSTTIDDRPVTLLVRASFFDASYGDRYLLRARLAAAPATSRAFMDSRALSGTARVELSDATLLPGRNGAWLTREILWPLHRATRTRLTRALGDGAGLANGVLLGERSQLDRPTQAAIRRLGITHLIAISGMHLTTVAACALAVAHLAPRWSGWCVLFVVSLYTGIVGGVDSLTRAYVMSLLMLGARGLVRPVRAVDALGKALFLMLLVSPLSIRSVGLQLSVAATLAVLIVLPHLSSRLQTKELSPVRRVVDAGCRAVVGAFVLSAAVEVFIAPLQIHYFDTISAVGPIATVLFFVPVSVVMVGAFVVAACAGTPLVSGPLAHGLEFVSHGTCASAVALARVLPHPIALPEPNILIYYGGVTVAWAGRRRRWIWPWGIVAMVASFFVGTR